MPQVDTPYIIGVIREKEKGFLEDDEYTRIVQAPSFSDAVRSLTETPYGTHLQQHESVFLAVQMHLAAEMQWLREMVEDERFIAFIAARYDGLHVAAALMDLAANRTSQLPTSWVGSLDPALLTSAIWHGERHDELPLAWRTFISEQLSLITDPTWRASALLVASKQHVVDLMQKSAYTPLMHQIAALYEQRLSVDVSVRHMIVDAAPDTPTEPLDIAEAMITDLRQLSQAHPYDRWWDQQLMNLIQQYKLEPVGYDPILAYWYAKELEVRTLRLLLSAKTSGVATSVLQELRRPLYYAS